ncbi:flavin-containing monooxygenase [Hydrocarboniphaga sp.]|uniref:flavin-containing monooxygenase n=1 Tax=Hydrocarboniphaga sp. TaxID=2033016 RepID=UPI003D0E9056
MNGEQIKANTDGDLDVLIVGAGWSGMYMLHQCRRLGLSARVIEKGPSVGGTWYWNRYPGLRCDVESMEYSFSFDKELQQEWDWSERYASQKEILGYANHVADRFDLRRDIAFNTALTALRFDEGSNTWTADTSSRGQIKARYVVMATGCLTVAKMPDIAGVADFKGAVYHTTNWPEQGVDFTGKRVGVIGTGSSAIQAIPIIAEQAQHLYVYQRTPSYSLPAHNRKLDPEYRKQVKARYEALRDEARHHLVGIPAPTHAASVFDVSPEQREKIYQDIYDAGKPFALMVSFADVLISKEANKTAQDFLAARIRERIKDPEIAEQMIPKGQYAGTRRLCIDTHYYETFNRPNVTLKNLQKDPIKRIVADGVETTQGSEQLDCLVFATGYDAMTGGLLAVDIQGRGGRKLRDQWAEGPRSLMGLMVAGFPNLFTVTGPGSPSVLSNMFVSIEQHVEFIAGCLEHLQRNGKHVIEADAEAQEQWVAHVNEVANSTLFPLGNTWYMGANIAGKPKVFMPYLGVGPYRQLCDQVASDGYRGFVTQ